ncbi:nuclear transport factor 2 family protein [Streptomyces sp. NRRL F-5630]|uniref:nuclear transport factor 2 family protein n=1 Tax=Streptomyces sp. NRRL F-5630 TaxID=1463864 RepID=UPI003EC038B1
MTTTLTLEDRIQRIEDRAEISSLAVRYAMAIDAHDWAGLAALFTEEVQLDFSEAGLPAQSMTRDQFAAFSEQGLGGWGRLQHLSPNHVVDFDEQDPNSARLTSYMFAQHHTEGEPPFVMHGSYDHDVVRTPDGWKIAALTQHLFWMDNPPAAMQR